MDILSIFRSSPEKQIAKARKRVKEPHGDAAVRINAARKLWEIGTPESILALLDRFTITSSPLVQDGEEKEDVLAWIVELGPLAVPPLKTFLKRERGVGGQRNGGTKGPEARQAAKPGGFGVFPNPSLALQASMARVGSFTNRAEHR